MPKITLQNDFITIADDFLPPKEWLKVSQAVKSTSLRRTVPGTAIWHGPTNEHPLESYHAVVWPPQDCDALVERCKKAAIARKLPMQFYPTKSAIDIGLEAIISFSKENANAVGQQMKDWVALTMSIYSYGAGTRANWHDDGRYYSGAFIFYTHSKWELDWGGEFLATPPGDPSGIGVFVAPRPNRLVLIKSGAPHSVSRISGQAGDCTRLSMTGFFIKEHRVNELISLVLSET